MLPVYRLAFADFLMSVKHLEQKKENSDVP